MSAKAMAIVLLACWVWVATAVAQEEPDQEPAPPVGGIVEEPEAAQETEVAPDTRPIAGAQPLTLGLGGGRSFLRAGGRFAQTVDTNAANQSGDSDWNAVSLLTGQLELQRLWKRMQTGAHYTLGASFNASRSGLNSSYHQFGIAQSFQFRRWGLSIIDEASYLPEASFGYVGLAGFAAPDLNPHLLPNQSILSTHSTRWSNSVVAQVNYRVGPRFSVTGLGSYAILRFPDVDGLDSDQKSFQAGFDYGITDHNTLGVVYGATLFDLREALNTRDFTSHSVQVAYGRRLTRKLALQVSGGPQITTFDTPVLGETRRVSWTANGSFSYPIRIWDANLGLSYFHSVTGGSGLLTGASSDVVQAAFNKRLTRTLHGSLTAGYSHNKSLGRVDSASFNSQFLSVGIRRPLWHQASLGFGYHLQHQTASTGICNGLICGEDLTRHSLRVDLNWHMRPILLGR